MYGMLYLSGVKSIADFAAASALWFPLTPLWLGIQQKTISLFDVECSLQSSLISGCVVLGWIISLCVEPGIEPATFRFQSKVLVTPLPSLRSSSTFLLLSLSLSFSLSLSPFHSLCASSFVSLPLSFLLLLLAEKKSPEKKNESVFIYVTLLIIHFLSL